MTDGIASDYWLTRRMSSRSAFGTIFAAHTVTEYIVENDQPDVSPLQTAQVGYSFLRGLRF